MMGLSNYYVFSVHKVMPPPMRALVASVKLGSTASAGPRQRIIGSEPYRFISRDYGIPCVVSGFESGLLQSIDMLLAMRAEGRADVEIQYRRVVRPEETR